MEVYLLANYAEEYKSKLTTPEQAVKVVKSGDWVWYGHFTMAPPALDAALAARKNELKDVMIKGICSLFDVKVAVDDPDNKSFIYHSGHMSAHDRHLSDKQQCFYVAGNYGQSPVNLKRGLMYQPNVNMIMTTPMDEKGFFNLGASNSYEKAVSDMCEYTIVEVNKHVPWCYGAQDEVIHISEVSHIVENHAPMIAFPADPPATEQEIKIANMLVEEISDGCCLQFGIGGMPNTIGKLLAQSDLKDLGIHSEMMADCFVDLAEKGIVNGKKKNIDTGKMVYTFAIGSQRLYDFMDRNPACLSYPVEITNSWHRIGLLDNLVCINNAVQVDLFNQVASESFGPRHISGVGGQLDFALGAQLAKNGKNFITMTSTRQLGGKTVSRIVPTHAGGTIVTTPRHVVTNLCTEYGIVNVGGKSTWRRAELVISIAHPDFRDDLVKEAQKLGIWTQTNKID